LKDPETIFWLVYVAITTVAGTTGAVIAQRRQLFNRIRRVRRRTIAQLEDNMRARVTGTVRLLRDVALPGALTGRSCVFYRAEVCGPGSTRELSRRKTLIVEELGLLFVIEDETGRAIIDPTDARIDLLPDVWSTTETWRRPTPRTDALLARHGFTQYSAHWRSCLWCGESVIRAGDRVTVVGLSVREDDPTTGMYREGGAAIRVRIGGSPGQPLWMTKHEAAAAD